jgi:ADP-heptose:LPS heptosyltransferase
MAGARILVIKQESLRQFVDAEPIFASIRAANPGVPVDLLTSPDLGRLAKGAPYFDRVLAAGRFDDKVALKELVTQLKRIGYEQIYDLDGTKPTLELRSAMTGFRGPRWIGPKRVMTKPGRAGAGFTGPAMRKLLSDAKVDVTHRLPDLQWALQGRKDAANMSPSWFGIAGDFALFVPADDPARRWPAAAYGELAQVLGDEGLQCVVIGPEELHGFAAEVQKQASPRGRNAAAGGVVDLTGKADLAQVAMLARHAAFFVAGIAETLDLCLAVGCPGLVLLASEDNAESDNLFGRDVIKLTAPDMARLSPDMALMMLRNMGLIAPEGHKPARYRA